MCILKNISTFYIIRRKFTKEINSRIYYKITIKAPFQMEFYKYIKQCYRKFMFILYKKIT